MDSAPVSSIVSLSMPIPMPPAGGIPCSRASRNSSSMFCRRLNPSVARPFAHQIMVTHAAPRPFQIDRAGNVSVSVSMLDGERATDFLSQITNQFFDEIRHLLEISIGPIGLKHREF